MAGGVPDDKVDVKFIINTQDFLHGESPPPFKLYKPNIFYEETLGVFAAIPMHVHVANIFCKISQQLQHTIMQ